MSLMPRMIKVWSILCTVLLSVGMMMAPTAPAWAFSDIAMGTTAEMLAMTDTAPADEALTDSEIDKLVGDITPDKPGSEEDLQQPRAAAGSLIQLNTACEGITTGANYFGRWKRLGQSGNKAKCKEGASGQPNNVWLTPQSCRIVTINDGNFDNGTIIGAKCVV